MNAQGWKAFNEALKEDRRQGQAMEFYDTSLPSFTDKIDPIYQPPYLMQLTALLKELREVAVMKNVHMFLNVEDYLAKAMRKTIGMINTELAAQQGLVIKEAEDGTRNQ